MIAKRVVDPEESGWIRSPSDPPWNRRIIGTSISQDDMNTKAGAGLFSGRVSSRRFADSGRTVYCPETPRLLTCPFFHDMPEGTERTGNSRPRTSSPTSGPPCTLLATPNRWTKLVAINRGQANKMSVRSSSKPILPACGPIMAEEVQFPARGDVNKPYAAFETR